MTLNFVQSQSTVMPELIDTTSSEYTVYIRQNVKKETATDEFNNKPYTLYTYDEAKLSKNEYQRYLDEINQLETNIDLDYRVTCLELGL